MLKKIYSDGSNHCVVLFHPHIKAMVNQVENWLTEVSRDGWKLVDKKGWLFYFDKSKENEIQYFIYSGFDSSPGIAYDFLRAKDRYSKSKSKLFELTYDVFEVDQNKIDEEYNKYRMLRNRFYRSHYIKLAVFCLVFIVISLIFSFSTPLFWIVGLPYMLLLIYAIISIIILTN